MLLLTACSSGLNDPKVLENFCRSIQVGSDYDQLAATLPNLGLEVRARTPEASQEISKGASNPYTVDGSVITSSDLMFSKTAPGCLIYFSSKLLGGDGRIINKQFTTSEIGG